MKIGKPIQPKYIRLYDVLTWKAQQKHNSKYRPFLVTNVLPDRIEAVPITHSAPTKNLRALYNVKVSANVNQAINEITEPKTNRFGYATKMKDNYYSPCNKVIVKKSKFYQNQFPEKLGNLARAVGIQTMRSEIENCDNMQIKAYEANKQFRYEMTHKGYVKNLYEREQKRKILRNKFFNSYLIAQQYKRPMTEADKYQPTRIDPPKQSYTRNEKHKTVKNKIVDLDDYL